MTAVDIRSELAQVVKVPITCPECGKEAFETVRRLQNVATLTCEGCGATLDLSGQEVRATLDKFIEACGGNRAPVAQSKGPR